MEHNFSIVCYTSQESRQQSHIATYAICLLMHFMHISLCVS